MENWGTFILINIVLVIVLGVITNLITPWIQSIYQRSVFASKRIRLLNLVKDYRRIREYWEIPSLLTAYLVRNVASLVFYAAGIAFIFGSAILRVVTIGEESKEFFFYFEFTASLFLLAILFYTLVTLIYTHNHFLELGKFRNETVSKILKLGGNPQWINEIDEEFEEAQETVKVQTPSKKRANKKPPVNGDEK